MQHNIFIGSPTTFWSPFIVITSVLGTTLSTFGIITLPSFNYLHSSFFPSYVDVIYVQLLFYNSFAIMPQVVCHINYSVNHKCRSYLKRVGWQRLEEMSPVLSEITHALSCGTRDRAARDSKVRQSFYTRQSPETGATTFCFH